MTHCRRPGCGTGSAGHGPSRRCPSRDAGTRDAGSGYPGRGLSPPRPGRQHRGLAQVPEAEAARMRDLMQKRRKYYF